MTDQNNRQINTRFQPGDIVQYTGKFWKFVNTIDLNFIFGIYDTPMVILERTIIMESLNDDDSPVMYNVLQGDNKFEVSDSWVELVK